MGRHQYYRVVFRLSNGRRKYSTHNGEMDAWIQKEVDVLLLNMRVYGGGAFTADFKHYSIVAQELKTRFPNTKLVKIVGAHAELYGLPINKNIIF